VEKDPARRFATPGEAADALQPFACPPSRLAGLLEADAGVAPVPARPRRPRRAVRRLAVALSLLAAAVLLGVLLRVKTPHGRIELTFREGLPDNAEVLVDGAQVAVRRVDDHKGEVTVRAGEHGVTVRAGGKVYRSPDKVEVTRAGTAWLTVTFEPSRPPGGAV